MSAENFHNDNLSKKKNFFKILLKKFKKQQPTIHCLDKHTIKSFSFEILPGLPETCNTAPSSPYDGNISCLSSRQTLHSISNPTYYVPLDDQTESFVMNVNETQVTSSGTVIENVLPVEEISISSKENTFMKLERSKSLCGVLPHLAKYGWYWGSLNRSEAEQLLKNKSNGAFLVRDSSCARLSLSFKAFGITLHTRIEHGSGWFSFYPQQDHDTHRSLEDLVNHGMNLSQDGQLRCKPPLGSGDASSVQLTHPVSRFMEVRPLLHLCRLVIRQSTSIHQLDALPLPRNLKKYLSENYY